MGIRGLYKFLQDMGYIPEQTPIVPYTKRLLIDAKPFMYTVMSNVPLNAPTIDAARIICSELRVRFGLYHDVTFINDGKISSTHPKFEESCKRKVSLNKRQETLVKKRQSILERQDQRPPEDEAQERTQAWEIDNLERGERGAQGVSLELSKQVIVLLNEFANFSCIQIEHGEADPLLIKLAADFDFVVSEDGDLLAGGVSNLLRHFGNLSKQCVYSAPDILQLLKLNLFQFQELAAISGNDYTQGGITGLGFKTAYPLMIKHGSLSSMIHAGNSNGKPIISTSEFLENMRRSMEMYQALPHNNVCESKSDEITTPNMSNKRVKSNTQTCYGEQPSRTSPTFTPSLPAIFEGDETDYVQGFVISHLQQPKEQQSPEIIVKEQNCKLNSSQSNPTTTTTTTTTKTSFLSARCVEDAAEKQHREQVLEWAKAKGLLGLQVATQRFFASTKKTQNKDVDSFIDDKEVASVIEEGTSQEKPKNS